MKDKTKWVTFTRYWHPGLGEKVLVQKKDGETRSITAKRWAREQMQEAA